MIPKEILKKVRSIHIKTSRMVNDILAGEYHSTFKGQGIEFDEVREYQPGDDIRSIDWNVTARAGKPFIKKFVEERELTVMLVVDASESGKFGSQSQLKSEYAAELCAVLAFSAIRNNDKVGLIIFTDTVEKFIPPKKGKKHVLRVIRETLFFKPKGIKTNIQNALEYLNSILKRKTVVFLVSDFIARNYEKAIRVTNKRHDLIPVVVEDPCELKLPKVGFIELEDAETKETLLIDLNNDHLRKMFEDNAVKEKIKRDKYFKQNKIDPIYVSTERSFIQPLVRFFKKREKLR